MTGYGIQGTTLRKRYARAQRYIGHATAAGLSLSLLGACGSNNGDQRSDESLPQQAVVLQTPPGQWSGQYADSFAPAQQRYADPRYGQAPPGYNYPPQYQQQYPAYAQPDPDNPWAARQPAYPPGYGYSAGVQQQRWGQTQPQQPVYIQPPAAAQYRPLESEPNKTESKPRAPAAPPTWSYYAPYDRRAGSSFGTAGNWPQGGNPYAAYPGYYGTNPYAHPGAAWPGGFGSGWPMGWGMPGMGWPMVR